MTAARERELLLELADCRRSHPPGHASTRRVGMGPVPARRRVPPRRPRPGGRRRRRRGSARSRWRRHRGPTARAPPPRTCASLRGDPRPAGDGQFAPGGLHRQALPQSGDLAGRPDPGGVLRPAGGHRPLRSGQHDPPGDLRVAGGSARRCNAPSPAALPGPVDPEAAPTAGPVLAAIPGPHDGRRGGRCPAARRRPARDLPGAGRHRETASWSELAAIRPRISLDATSRIDDATPLAELLAFVPEPDRESDDSTESVGYLLRR